MKNNIKNIVYILIFISLFISAKSVSEEIKFEANSIELIDKDERILAKKNVKIFNKKETIYADEMDYDKLKQIIKAKGNIIVENTDDKIRVLSDRINYDKKSEIIIFYNNVSVELKNKFYFKTNQAIYNKSGDEITINSPSNFKDNFGNEIKSKNLKFLVDKKLLKINSVELIDQLKNKYFFENAIIDLNTDQLVADGIKIDFFKETFGNSENDPRLRGNYFYSDSNISLIKKGVFTTCKKKMEKNVHLGNLKQKKLNTIKIKKLYIIKMHGWKFMINLYFIFQGFFIRILL